MDKLTLLERLFPAQIRIIGITDQENILELSAESSSSIALCPACKEPSGRKHSRYIRRPVDLALSNWHVVLNLSVTRYFCDNPTCAKRTFAERFSDFLVPYSRSTERVARVRRLISTKMCAKTAEGLLKCLGIGTSDTTILRNLRALPDPPQARPRVIGVDDWAKRKGQQYGTIIVDLEEGEIIDLLLDRTTETFSIWLDGHPDIEVVSRDRARNYADAITQSLPHAVQVADRWHLLKNLSDTVYKALQRESKTIRSTLKTYFLPAQSPEIKLENSREPSPAELRRKERIEHVLKYHRLGWSQKDIARTLNIHPKSVQRYLNNPDHWNRRSKRGSKLDPYKPYLLKRWREGCQNASQLFREIRIRGYPGSTTIVLQHLSKFRVSSDLLPTIQASNRLPSLRSLTWYIVRTPDKREDEHERLLEELCLAKPEIARTVGLARQFATIVRERKSDMLESWLDDAEDCGQKNWPGFARSLKQDLAAVGAALSLDWSNGPTEGHVNLLKCVKRQMYGRAKDDLLRKRLLWHGRWTFT